MNARTKRPEVWVLLLLTVALRLPWMMLQPTDPAVIRAQLPDQAEYLEAGRNLLVSHSLHFDDPRFPGEVFAFRMPGYPFFIALLGAKPTLVRLAQIGLDCATVLGVYLLAKRYVGASRLTGTRRVWVNPSVFAGILIALNPWMIYFSSLILTETLFTSLLIWAMVLMSLRWPDRRKGLIGGIVLLGLSVYVRPSAMLLPVVMGIGAVLANRRESTAYYTHTRLILREGVLLALIAGITIVALLFPWAVRNRLHPQINVLIWTTTNAGFTAYDGFGPDATGASNQLFVQSMPELQTMNELQRSDHLAQLAKQQMRADPMRVLSLSVRKIARTWSPLPLSVEYSSLKYILPGLLYSIPFFILVLIGLWKSPLPRTVKLFLLLPALYFTLVHAMSVGSARYRIPVEAPLTVIASSVLKRRFGDKLSEV